MWLNTILNILSTIPFTILHVMTPNSFPKPLSSKEEKKYMELNMLKKGLLQKMFI